MLPISYLLPTPERVSPLSTMTFMYLKAIIAVLVLQFAIEAGCSNLPSLLPSNPSQTVVLPRRSTLTAQDKRQRNSEACARWRVKRRERQKETDNIVPRLQNKIKELEEEVNHHKRERDYFRPLALATPEKSEVSTRVQAPLAASSSESQYYNPQIQLENDSSYTKEESTEPDSKRMPRFLPDSDSREICSPALLKSVEQQQQHRDVDYHGDEVKHSKQVMSFSNILRRHP